MELTYDEELWLLTAHPDTLDLSDHAPAGGRVVTLRSSFEAGYQARAAGPLPPTLHLLRNRRVGFRHRTAATRQKHPARPRFFR
jgi:hypothetical protein